VGPYTEVLPSPIGYEILMVTDAREAMIPKFEEVRVDVARVVEMQRQTALRDQYVRSLAADTEVVIVMDDMREYFADGVFPQ
ncbi:MAG: hypothetical protein WBG92_20515, partial [Thiohalocapsa sp.]